MPKLVDISELATYLPKPFFCDMPTGPHQKSIGCQNMSNSTFFSPANVISSAKNLVYSFKEENLGL